LQFSQSAVQLVLQHTVSRQKPERHMPALLPQVMPGVSFAMQVLPLQ
jgi:hypothetical protein